MKELHLRSLAGLCFVAALSASVSCGPLGKTRFCFGDDLCIEPDGQQVFEDGRPICEVTNTCGDTMGGSGPGPDTDDPGDLDVGDTDPTLCFRCTIADLVPEPGVDTDGDCIPDTHETNIGGAHQNIGGGCYSRVCDDGSNRQCGVDTDCAGDGSIACIAISTDPNDPDTDDDGILDGCEDRNQNGEWTAGEMYAFNPDSDCDGITDEKEDSNRNGSYDPPLETDGTRNDTDGDGIPDGVEDRDQDGEVDEGVDLTGPGRVVDGCIGSTQICDDATGDRCHFNDTDPTCLRNTCVPTECLGSSCIVVYDTEGESDPRNKDSDGDRVPDHIEDVDKNGLCNDGETCNWSKDTDCDGLEDGIEDLNHNGIVNSLETDPLNWDTDADELYDGLEDRNRNGRWDQGEETDAKRADTDSDNIQDGIEDKNQDGDYQQAVLDARGCWDGNDGETDPRRADSDYDGIPDNFEDQNQDGHCEFTGGELDETCAFIADTDCDGIPDGAEDKNHNGRYEYGETDARRIDTDLDGLIDGCPPWVPLSTCPEIGEDAGFDGTIFTGNDGIVDFNETDPAVPDTDDDGLTDGCERGFVRAASFDDCVDSLGKPDPLYWDSDRDGVGDGEEDSDHSCATDGGETDPCFANPSPHTSSIDFVREQVCATGNLKKVTFARVDRPTHDYQIAFEVERAEGTGSGPIVCQRDSDCNPNATGQTCTEGPKPTDPKTCVNEGQYIIEAFGKDNDGDGFDLLDDADEIGGHIFQSPKGVYRDEFSPDRFQSRNVYGFVVVKDGVSDLDVYLDSIRDALAASAEYAGVTQTSALLARPAHDSLPSVAYPSPLAGYFPINRAQRVFQVELSSEVSFLALRNTLLKETVFAGPGPFDHTGSSADFPPTLDPVRLTVNCGLDPWCGKLFSVYVTAVQRVEQTGPTGQKGTVVLLLGLTLDDREEGPPSVRPTRLRLYNDRVVRLEDLTGGSAIGRAAASIDKECVELPQSKAVADLLWVVDDSASMQRNIRAVQRAAKDARAALTANSEIIDFRVALTTSNPSRTLRVRCPQDCDGNCGPDTSCPASCDDYVGCVNICPAGCDTNCTISASCPAGSCDPPCEQSLANAINFDATGTTDGSGELGAGDRFMPGGGGTFYFEDVFTLDCKGTDSERNINVCPYQDPSDPDSAFGMFYDTGGARKKLSGNAGFLGSGELCINPSDPTNDKSALLDITPEAKGLCHKIEDYTKCCDRLTHECSDGPTVMASQMCDLIRAMGGLPDDTSSEISARPHSAPEHGIRSARRLLQSMLPALPADYEDTCTAPCAYDAKKQLRLACKSTEVCEDCDPALDRTCRGCELCDTAAPGATCCNPADSDCWQCEECDPQTDPKCRLNLVPMVTVVLSDEEDFYFKDDCQPSASDTDRSQLPAMCNHRLGDAGSFESCDSCVPPIPCTDDSDCSSGTCGTDGLCTCTRREYCATFANAGPPSGYNPDLAVRDANPNYTMQWRKSCSSNADCDFGTYECRSGFNRCEVSQCDMPLDCPEACQTNYLATTCATDPCVGLGQNVCQSATITIGGTPYPYCDWTGTACRNRCDVHTQDYLTDQTCQTDAIGCAQRVACEADPVCEWVQAYVNYPDSLYTQDACQPRYPYNDCRACKRFNRLLDTVDGGQDPISLQQMIGFDDLGPIYAIVRDRGVQGFGGEITLPQDPCDGGKVTWGLGDGEAYRQLAAEPLGPYDTVGRTQDICADNYTAFMADVISDIAALSAPYPLREVPIASTLKVGVAHCLAPPCDPGDLSFEYIQVDRSSTRGFFYDASSNSIAFKSDPIDGDCDEVGGVKQCSADGIIEETEILWAQAADIIPKESDWVFISYRYWLPVPCLERCSDTETCVTLICSEDGQGAECPDGTDLKCSAGYVCDTADNRCKPVCPGQTDAECPEGFVCNAGDCLSATCPGGLDSECPLGFVCNPQNECVRSCPNGNDPECDKLGYLCDDTNQCELGCTVGELADVCAPRVCGLCENYDPATDECVPVGDLCLCNPTGVPSCKPGVLGTCPIGFFCDEGCGCVPIPGCPGGFSGTGSLAECRANLECCQAWKDAQTECRKEVDSAACGAQPAAACTRLGLDNTVPLNICTGTGNDCTTAADCGGEPCITDTECGYLAPCAYGGGICDFAYPTCCGVDETPDCTGAFESGRSELICVAECVCAGGCEAWELCERDPSTNECACYANSP